MSTATMTATQLGPTMQEHTDYNMEDAPNTPTTPRALAAPSPSPAIKHTSESQGGVSGQQPLPTSPLPEPATPEHSSKRESSAPSEKPVKSNPDAMDVDDSDDDQEGSGDETEGEQTNHSTKKKKGQRFFCTQFPPCNLSFTRSEHLARHIRKHTGERPFQCHCNRRFSRLDNLRQHAQTVHVNEDIPGDSLAATGTRFQRQIRTDRVRPPGSRARSGTAGSQGSHSRGHSRNLSTSSIGSTTSNFSTAPEGRRRPPPLIMANDPTRNRMSTETTSPPTTPTSQYTAYPGDSSGGYSTPTSTVYSTGPGSPTFGGGPNSNYASPSRSGLFTGPAPARRLSVPSSANPFMSPHGHSNPPYMSPLGASSSYSSTSSVFASPTSSTFSFSRADPNLSAEAEWRRRTWHPTTYTYSGNATNYARPATSGLSYSQTPDAPQPAFAPNATAAAGPSTRLPGIESFDQVQHRPSTPPRRQPSPARDETGSGQTGLPPPSSTLRSHPAGPDHRRGHISWDLSLHSNLNRLDLHSSSLSKDAGQWGQQTINDIHEAASRPLHSERPPPIISQQPIQPTPPARHQGFGQQDVQTAAAQRSKRHGWYNGPIQPAAQLASAARTSPEDSSSSEGVPTPGTSAAEYHPAIVHSNGYIEHQHSAIHPDGSSVPCGPPTSQSHPNYPARHGPTPPAEYYSAAPPPRHDLGRLEALVAVATSEDNAATTAR